MHLKHVGQRIFPSILVAAMLATPTPVLAQLSHPPPTKKQAHDFPTYPTEVTFQQVYLGGKPTIDDEITIEVKDSGLANQIETVTYRVQPNDTLQTIARALASAINLNSGLSSIGVGAMVSKTVITIGSESTHKTNCAIHIRPESSVVVHEVWNCGSTRMLSSWTEGNTGATETARFGINPSRLWYAALSGDNRVGTTIFNNRLVTFDHSQAFQNEWHEDDKILQQALDVAQGRFRQDVDGPGDVVDCLCNLGCLNYLWGDKPHFQAADDYFQKALTLTRRSTVKSAPALAPILEFGAMAARALAVEDEAGDYSGPEAMYKEALQIRTSQSGFYKPDVAFAMMNLACLYHDWALQASPEQSYICGQNARRLEEKADELMNENPHPNLAERYMTQAVNYHNRSCPAHPEYDPDPSSIWQHRIKARNAGDEADERARYAVLVNSRAREDVVPGSMDLSNPPCARPSSPCLTVNSGSDQLKNMVAFAKDIIAKDHARKARTDKTIDAVGATILGHWSINADVAVDPTTGKAIDPGTPTTGTEKKTPVEDVTIYLCHYDANPKYILYKLYKFGQNRGLTPENLAVAGIPSGWPATHQQALELQAELDNEAEQIKYETKQTDKHGDFIFKCVPRGDYLLYASVVTAKEFKIFLIPGNPDRKIHVDRIMQVDYDFTEKTGKLLWEAGHPVESQTPDDLFPK